MIHDEFSSIRFGSTFSEKISSTMEPMPMPGSSSMCSDFASARASASDAPRVFSGRFLDRVVNREALPRRGEVDLFAADLPRGGSVHRHGGRTYQFFHERHHPSVIVVGHIEFEQRELGVVRAVIPSLRKSLENSYTPSYPPTMRGWRYSSSAMRRKRSTSSAL